MVRSGFQGIFQQLDGLIVTPRLDIFLSHSHTGIRDAGFQETAALLHIGGFGQRSQASAVIVQSFLVLALGILLTRLP